MWLDTYVPVCRIVLDSVTELPDFFWRSPTGCKRLQALETCQPSLMSHQLLKIFFFRLFREFYFVLVVGAAASVASSPALRRLLSLGLQCQPSHCPDCTMHSNKLLHQKILQQEMLTRKCSSSNSKQKTALSIENLTKNYLTKFRTIREGGGTATTLLIR